MTEACHENQKGQPHRLDGPVLTLPDGKHIWAVNGINITRVVEVMMRNKTLRKYESWTDEDREKFAAFFG